MQFPKFLTINNKFLLVSILPILFAASISAMNGFDDVDYQQIEDIPKCNFCCWKQEGDRDPWQEETETKCNLLRSIFCRCKSKEYDIEAFLTDEKLEKESRFLCMSTEKWKRTGTSTLDILTKSGIALWMHDYFGQNEIAFFAQHHASEAIGRHLEFNNKWGLLLYPISFAAVYGTGIGIFQLEDYVGYSTGFGIVGFLTMYKIINNIFAGVNPEKGDRALKKALKEIESLKSGQRQLEQDLEQLRDHRS